MVPAVHLKCRETQIAILEIALLKLLVALARARLHAARQMHLAVFSDQRAIGAKEHGRIEALAVLRQFGIADVETDAEPARSVEQGLDLGVRHRAFKERLKRGFADQPSGKERGEGQLRKDHQLHAPGGPPFEKRQQPL
jgi:hypothetical protein